MPDGTATAHFYRPKLVTTLRDGYRSDQFRCDLLAGLTVAIVALPLSMAIAVASGISPERGLYTAIIGGALVSALGGSRFQIGGPAGAFIVLIAGTVAKFGIEGLLLTVLLSGLMLILVGLLGFGSLIRHIPHAVTVGFTCGISVTILASQLKDLAGLKLLTAEPGPFIPKLVALADALQTTNPAALVIGLVSSTLILLLKRIRPNWPGMLIAVVAASAAASFLNLPVETIGSRFGDLPHGLLMPRLPTMSWTLLQQVLPSALSFTLLGSIESLLSAKVADGMTGRKHRSNMELVAQGIANIGSAIFGGTSVTGTIARTATNVRAGAKSPVAGIAHSVFLLVFLLVAAPVASYVPLSALAGILLVVCWNMVQKDEIQRSIQQWRGTLVLLATFSFTLIEDLTIGIVVGCALAATFAALGYRVTENDA